MLNFVVFGGALCGSFKTVFLQGRHACNRHSAGSAYLIDRFAGGFSALKDHSALPGMVYGKILRPAFCPCRILCRSHSLH